MKDQHSDDAARGNSDTEHAEQKSPWSTKSESNAEEERSRQVRRKSDHRRTTPRRPGRVVERGDRALTGGTNRGDERRDNCHGERHSNHQGDRGGTQRRGGWRPEE